MVSILTRPWGRVQRNIYQGGAHADAFLFQSSPARGGGCNSVIEVGALRTTGFNPHPPVGAGATLSPPVQGASVRAFQSSPARGAGATRAEAVGEGFFKGVSILTRPWGRVQPLGHVSILTRPWGRVQRVYTRCTAYTAAGFQSSPARGGGCNAICK